MKQKERILLVEDDVNFGSVLKSYLELNEFEVILKNDGVQGLNVFRKELFNMCIIDVMLPNMDGFTLAKEIKLINSSVPFIFLTAKTLKADIIEGFKIGAYDYVTKPFDTDVLLLKIKAILKANVPQPISIIEPEEFHIGKYIFNFKFRTIYLNENEQVISPKEAKLLRLLCVYKNNMLSRESALKAIWGEESYFTTRSMDVYITKLRKFLKDDKSIEIVNIHGDGFRLSVKE
jgi:two-component system, OmpR family, response regulator